MTRPESSFWEFSPCKRLRFRSLKRTGKFGAAVVRLESLDKLRSSVITDLKIPGSLRDSCKTKKVSIVWTTKGEKALLEDPIKN